MQQISFATPDELKLRISTSPDNSQTVDEDASALHLIFSECARGVTIPEAYERFRIRMSQRWGVEVNTAMAYLVVETAIGATNQLKKTSINVLNSTSSA